jgi:hypothetical protein
MRSLAGMLLLTLALLGRAVSQVPAVDVTLTVSDVAGGIQSLHFGIDPVATDGIDALLGETELPPAPPIGVFDARFVGDDIGLGFGQGLLKDYRQGGVTTAGVRVHEIKYQVGTGTSIVISWDLPSGVTGRLQDVILGTLIDQPMSNSGSYMVTNPGSFSRLKMTVTYGIPSGIVTDGIPASYGLNQNYPNPFNPRTRIRYQLPRASGVLLRVFNVLGQVVATLEAGNREAGSHFVEWTPALPSGVYFYRLEARQTDDQPDFGLAGGQAGDASTGSASSPRAGSARGFVETKRMILLN